MFSRVVDRFTENPTLYYSMSIAATWAGVGSLVVGMQMAREYGVIPFLLWALGNTLACVLFGLLAPRIPRLRDVFRSKLMNVAIGIMCVFQVWLNMNGIQTVFEETPLTSKFGIFLAYAVAVFFIILLLKFGMIRNVLTDYASWSLVYGVAFVLTLMAMFFSRGNMFTLPVGASHIPAGLEKLLLLLPGAFLYPYFYEILDYNEGNQDGTRKIDIGKAFVGGGLLFGAYLMFTFLLAKANFSPLLNTIKAFLISLVAISTISSFLYSIYLTFGKRVGTLVNVATVVLWQWLIPMGVLGVWTFMSSIRIFIVLGGIGYALMWNRLERKAVRA